MTGTVHGHVDVTWPTPLPKWWWPWCAWRDAGGIPSERPAGIPKQIPEWSWERYRLHRGTVPPAAKDPYALLGVFERVAFFVNPTAGSPVGGAKEIYEGARSAGVTICSNNVGDGGDWGDWQYRYPVGWNHWTRCDTLTRCRKIGEGDIANIESPEIAAGFCTPEHAVELVGREGAVITEATVPHADWTPVAKAGVTVFIEIDPNVPAVREHGVTGLVEYGRTVVGHPVVVPCLFMVESPWWDGGQASFPAYWRRLRDDWPGPFALYSAENTPDWRVIA